MNALRIASTALALCAAASAQLTLDKIGGGIPGTASFPIQGPASAPYFLLMSLTEQQTPIPGWGITLDVGLELAGLCGSIPGFAGTLPASGKVAPSLTIPNLPELEGQIFSLQLIGDIPPKVSNLVRLTPQRVGTFLPALNSPSVPVLGGGFANVANNEIVFCGGSGPVAQRYESRTEKWSLAGVTFGVGLFSQTTGLNDGRVLLTGGIDTTTGQPTNAAAVYDPITQQTTTLTMSIARAGHGASLMGNGKVLVSGGFQVLSLTDPLALFAGIRASTEIFDPVTNTFTPGPNMLEARALHASTSLTNGQVLVTGGLTLIPIVNIPTVSATAYRFNPATNSFGLPAVMGGARFLHSAVGLSDGKVLIAGGITLDLTVFLQTLNIADIIVGTRSDCQLYTPSIAGFGTFANVAGMQEGRAGAAIAALPGGKALIAGGFRLVIDIPTSTFQATATATADLFSQGPNAIVPTGSMAAPRLLPITANLADGTVMVLGGGPTNAEIYQF